MLLVLAAAAAYAAASAAAAAAAAAARFRPDFRDRSRKARGRQPRKVPWASCRKQASNIALVP